MRKVLSYVLALSLTAAHRSHLFMQLAPLLPVNRGVIHCLVHCISAGSRLVCRVGYSAAGTALLTPRRADRDLIFQMILESGLACPANR